MNGNIIKPHKRISQFKIPEKKGNVCKYAKKERIRRYTEKQRITSILIALRDAGLHTVENDYSINVIASLLPVKDQLTAKGINSNKLPAWRFVDKNKTCFYQLVMRGIEEQDKNSEKPDDDKLKLVPFVFNLSDNVIKRVLNAAKSSKKSEVSLYKDEMTKALKTALNRSPDSPVEFWFQLEMAPKAANGKPHLQGSLLISINEEDRIKKMFHKINGHVTSEFKSRAIRLLQKVRQRTGSRKGLLYTDLNWAMYCHKENARVKRLYADQRTNRMSQVFTASRSLNKHAEDLYQKLRDGPVLVLA